MKRTLHNHMKTTFAFLLGLVLTASIFVQTANAQTGSTWTSRTATSANNWASVTCGNGLFVAVSYSGSGNRVMTSPDGITWTGRTAAADNVWYSVTYGNGLFVAVSSSGTGNRVMTSPDGITWTRRTSAADNNWYSVTYGNGLFVAVSTSGTGNRVMTSPDGITWTIRTSAADNIWFSVTYGNGLFVAVSTSGTGNRVMTSPDGITWTSRTSAANNDWFSVTYGNSLFVAVAQTGTGNRVMTSPDGITWTSRTSAANNPWYSVTYGNGLFVAVASDGTNQVMTSPDGITWTSRTSAANNAWRSITYSNGLFVAVSPIDPISKMVMTSGTFSSVTVSGSGGSANGDYPTLKAAFDALNLVTTQAGNNIVITVWANTTEIASAVLNQPSVSSWASLKIYPTVAGLSITGNLAAPLIDLNGADNVTIDGSVNQADVAKSLSITNTSASSTSGTSTIRFKGDASSNTVKYCTIKGSSTDAESGILFFSTGTSTGNINNTIDNNDITNSANANRPLNAIYSLGSTGAVNSGNTISNNNIYDFLSRATASNGIYLGSYTSAYAITGNSFYETASFTPMYSVTYFVININEDNGTGFTVSNNFIGGSSSSCGGKAWTKTNANSNTFYGIYISAGTSTASNIQGNIIRNFAYANNGSDSWIGININRGNVNVGTTTGNTIGASSGIESVNLTNSSTGGGFYGINNYSPGITNIQNNTIGSITVANSDPTLATHLCGIYNLSSGTTTISNNIIGSKTTANSINASTASSLVNQNVYGICNYNTGTNTISGNTIANLNNASTRTNGSVAGILYYGYGSSTVSSVSCNFINSLTASGSGSTAAVYGIQIQYGLTTYSNNIISLVGNTPTTIYGIYEIGLTSENSSLYFNTVYLGGTPTTGVSNSYALYSAGIINARNFRNNIFDNARSTNGNHYAAYITPPTTGTLTCDYNDYLASGTGGMLGNYGGDKSTSVIVTGQDANSKNTNPSFANAGGTTSSSYIPSTSLPGTSVSTFTTDYAGTTRAATPTMGAYERSFSSGWTGTSSTDWNTPGNWNPSGVPNASANVTIPSSVTKPIVESPASSPAICNSLTINSDAIITIAPGKALTVTGTLTNNSTGGVVIQSDATGTGSLIVGTSAGTGTAITQCYMPLNTWHLLGSPVSGQTISNTLSSNGTIATNVSDRGMMDYNESVNNWNSFFTSLTSGSILPGKGYSSRIDNGSIISFTGALNAATTNVAITRTGDYGWNCIGNPFTSAIKINTSADATNNFITLNLTNLDPSYACIYVWNPGTSRYDIFNNSSSASYAAVEQGFIVKAPTGGSTISFTPAMQLHHVGTVDLKSAQLAYPEIKLVVQTGSSKTSTSIKFIIGMTKGLDVGYDAGIFKSDPLLALYTKLVEDNGIQFAIQALPDNNFNSMIIPVGIDSKTGGDVVFSAESTNLPSDCKVILEDKLTKTFTDLSVNVYKAVIMPNTTVADRFQLHTSTATIGTLGQSILSGKLNAFATGNTEIHVVGQVSGKAVATLYDVLGKAVAIQKLSEGTLNVIPLSNIKSGVYILSVENKGITSYKLRIME